ncbi:MAG: DUF4058 family protein [Coleofasciculaceae cyanobacterium]
MPSPFPGMNPYLEHHALWPEVHKRLIVAIADTLSPQLRPKYRVAIEERIYQTSGEDSVLVGIPDVVVQSKPSATNKDKTNITVASPPVKPMTITLPLPETVREGYLEVRDVATREVVTAIEILSPKNKRAGEGREAYKKKRQRVLGSLTHLVEIDLLRAGEPMPVFGDGIQGNYRILISREERRPQAELYVFNLQHEIPKFPLPLRSEDIEPIVDLQALLEGVYDRAAYDLVIDYSKKPVPSLSEVDAAWADALLREKGLR